MIEISTSALINNIKVFRKMIDSKVKLMAVVKANAYGHGLLEVAQIIKNKVDWFGVNNDEEGIQLRRLKINRPILILGYTPLDIINKTSRYNLSFVVYNQDALKNHARVHLKIETGTNRQGIKLDQIDKYLEIIKNNPNITLEGVYTHFADIEDKPDFSFTHRQLAVFETAVKQIKKSFPEVIVHSACTAAISLFPETHFDLVRLGIGLYGLQPSNQFTIDNLQPVLCWKSQFAQIKMVKKGETIGYGRTYKAKNNLTIAVIPVGYYDGYDRKLSNCGRVIIKNKYASVIGRICMNMFMVDVTNIKNIKVDDEVVLIGKQGNKEITVDEIAQKCGTINYEIVSRINPFIPRVIVK